MNSVILAALSGCVVWAEPADVRPPARLFAYCEPGVAGQAARQAGAYVGRFRWNADGREAPLSIVPRNMGNPVGQDYECRETRGAVLCGDPATWPNLPR